jgi:hypothetical protein
VSASPAALSPEREASSTAEKDENTDLAAFPRPTYKSTFGIVLRMTRLPQERKVDEKDR